MKLRLSDERASDDLLADLRARLDYVVAKEGPRTLGVGVIGSYRDGGRAEVERYLTEWRASHPGVAVEVVDAD
jgi:hypothetical protein